MAKTKKTKKFNKKLFAIIFMAALIAVGIACVIYGALLENNFQIAYDTQIKLAKNFDNYKDTINAMRAASEYANSFKHIEIGCMYFGAVALFLGGYLTGKRK